MRATEICTTYRILILDFSEKSVFLLSPRKSMLNDVVNEVIAPSALGNAAEISPIRKITPATGPR